MSIVNITVRETGSGRILREPRDYALPMKFGRSTSAEMSFPDYPDTMSRLHFKVEERGGEIVLLDESTNDVYLRHNDQDYRIGKGNQIALSAAPQVFHTVGLEVTINTVTGQGRSADSSTILAKHNFPVRFFGQYTSRSGQKRSKKIGPLALAMVKGESGFSLHNFEGAEAHELAAHLEASGILYSMIVGPTHDGGAVLIANQDNGDTRCNRASVPRGPQTLKHFDTVEVGRWHMHILEPGGPQGLECVNPACKQLNPYDPRENCDWCGTMLGTALTQQVRS